MPQSLVHELIEQRSNGVPWGTSLKRAIFQAKSTIGYIQDGGEAARKKKFKLWKVHMRGMDDSEPVDWWFASTAVPILAATLGPMANVISIGALVTSWRIDQYDPANPGQLLTPLQELMGTSIKDPAWCYWVNVVSLICGFLGNLFLLLNFTGRARYIICNPLSAGLWFCSFALLVSDVSAMHAFARPKPVIETYSEGFWYAIAATCLYLILTALLLLNILGYVRGHYPQRFNLTEDQRTLIVQTMLFFIWLAGGAGVFSRIEGWHFVDALYYCDVTILTIGFGDLYPTKTASRAILIPYSVGGIIMLGLVISAIYKSVQDIGGENIIRHHFEQQRERTMDRTVTTSIELERREVEMEIAKERELAKRKARGSARSPATAQQASIATTLSWQMPTDGHGSIHSRRNSITSLGTHTSGQRPQLHRTNTFNRSLNKQKQTIVLLREEKERFEAMRKIQHQTELWRNWWRLGVSLGMFSVFWLVGALIFYEAETDTQSLSYWENVYFCWVAILSIGYGDFSPKSGSGRCFFVIWSLMAVPSVTILAGDLTKTVVAVFNHASNELADFTLLPHHGVWKTFTRNHPWMNIRTWLTSQRKRGGKTYRDTNGVLEGHSPDPEKAGGDSVASTINGDELDEKRKEDALAAGKIEPDLPDLAAQRDADIAKAAAGTIPDAAVLARHLALAIRRSAHDLGESKASGVEKKYSYEEWVEFTRLIRFSAAGGASEAIREGDVEGLVEWDWIGEDSPMMARASEPEFVLDRLVESLVRYLRRNPPKEGFAAGLREQGEDALRFRSKIPDEEPPADENAPPSSGARLIRANSGTRLAVGIRDMALDSSNAQHMGLHPVDEHEDEHQPDGRQDDDLEIRKVMSE